MASTLSQKANEHAKSRTARLDKFTPFLLSETCFTNWISTLVMVFMKLILGVIADFNLKVLIIKFTEYSIFGATFA